MLDEVGAARVAKRQLGELSGGELQRVVLARALLRDPTFSFSTNPCAASTTWARPNFTR